MKSLHKPEVWEKILKESHDKPVIVFKHSNTCGTSEEAHQRIKKLESQGAIAENMYILIVQNAREISDRVAEDLDVKHESPQVIVVSEGEAIYHASHEDIDPDVVAQKIVEAH